MFIFSFQCALNSTIIKDKEHQREVPIEQAQQFADYHNLLFLETSSKTGYNVEKTFLQLASRIYDLLEEGKFRIQEGWDGIKSGYMPSTPLGNHNRPPISLIEVRSRNNSNIDGQNEDAGNNDEAKKNCC